MRKKIALFLAAIMVVGTLPMTAFAGTDNEIDRVATVQDGTAFTAELIIDDVDTKFTTESIKLTLTNAEWDTPAVEAGLEGMEIEVDDYSDTKAFVDFTVVDNKAVLYLNVIADGEGEATVTIEDVKSDVTEETLKIANIIDDATITTIDGTKALQEGNTTIKDIVIEEVVAGSLEDGTIKFRLAGGFEWAEVEPTVKAKYAGTIEVVDITFDGRDMYIEIEGETVDTEAVLVITGAAVNYDADDVDFGTDCEVVISGAGVDKTTLLVCTAADYAVTFTVEDEELPQLWAGEEDTTETLEVTIKEKIANSWIHERVAKITFPEGIKVVDADGETEGLVSINKDLNVITVEYAEDFGTINETFSFDIVAAADFEGDVEVTLSGSATGAEEQTVVVATVAKKWAVEADTNELIIDYRNTAASDIVITEAEAGLWEKGEVITLALDKMLFEGNPEITVEEGDMKITDKSKDGVLSFAVKQESIKDAAVIRISGIELYMSRSFPAGEYDLSIVANDADKDYVAFENDFVVYNGEDEFEVEEMTVCEGYVTVVTAGREQDDSTFTTKVVVTIGAATMQAGSKVIALDVPAFIDGGYTMLPVRAVAESLSDAAIIKWDDATKTVVIFFGQRTISMTIGSKVMVINGVDVAMSAAPVIVNGRTFLPLRDLGYALGLNEDKIAWDDATKTATLN
jgi:hypothetical protein